MANPRKRITLHSRKTMFILLAGFLTLFFLFVSSYKRHLLEKENARVVNHAKVISTSLWNYDKMTSRDYLSLSMDSNSYQEITVRDEYDRVFLRLEGKPAPAFEQFLSAIRLIHVHQLRSDIFYSDRKIGTINVRWPCKAIYLYLYVLFCSILLLNGIALYLKLLDAKSFLESRVKQRTAELELEVHQRKKAQDELKLQAQRLSMHVQHTPLAVVEWSTDFKIIEWNKAAESIFEYSKTEVMGKTPFGLIITDTAEKHVSEIWQKLISHKGGTRSINTNLTKSGKIKTCDWYNTTLTDADGEVIGAASLVLDITEQVETENRNKMLQEQLVQAQKMEAVGNMAGGIAHDFNNLLQSISGYTQLLLLECHKKGEDCAKLEGIEKASGRAADLVRQLLTFSRKIESNLAPLDLNREIQQIRTMLERTLPKMIEIEMHLDPELQFIKGDPVQIEQILLNLAINASHAMNDGGRLTIETQNTDLDQPFCNAHLGASQGPNVLLQITDTGAGMDQDTVNRIFEPFFTTKETGKGTGLGLSSVYGIVKAHRGYIDCNSELNKGTRFRLFFPAIPRQLPRREGYQEPSPLPRGTETVLLVDDERTIREIGVEMLRGHGYTVLTAASGEEALDVYAMKANDIGIVVLDLNMPGMGGFKCLQELKRQAPGCLVLIASGYTPADSIKRATELGADGFLSKPFQMDSFLRKIRQTLDHSTQQ